MIEIRPIRRSEGETFLGLMCDVFELDYARAYDVFFAEPMFDMNRKWALFEDHEMASILTTTPLIFGWGRAFGIAGVATRRDRQGIGLASTLLERVIEESERVGEPAAMLFARNVRFYERNGFECVDEVVRADFEVCGEPEGEIIESEEVELIYNAWAGGHPDRLRRDSRRWNYWKWNFRVPTEFAGGYLCHEPGTLREAMFTSAPGPLPLPEGTQWFGTRQIAAQMQIPLETPQVELYLMIRKTPGHPQLFMTDQF